VALLPGLADNPVSSSAARDDAWIDYLTIDNDEPEEIPASEGDSATLPSTHTIRCLGGATSNDPERDITVQVQIWVDGRLEGLSSAWGYSPSALATATVPSVDYERPVACYAMAPAVWAAAYGSIAVWQTPREEISWEGFSYWWDGRFRRDVYYQVWHFDGAPWQRGGEIWEEWAIWHNPCNIGFQRNLLGASLDNFGRFVDSYVTVNGGQPLGCEVIGDQQYRLTSSAYQVIGGHRWRFDNSGIWRQ
jgi:hypothetical protein